MNNCKTKAYFLIKIGKEEFMNRLLNEGLIYMNSVSYFRNNNNPEQGDALEGALIIQNGVEIRSRESFEKEKIYCMWHLNDLNPTKGALVEFISDSEVKLSFDFRKYLNFGIPKDNLKMVIITNVVEFHKRVRKALNKMGYKGRYYSKNIEYFNPNSSEPIYVNAFMKPDTYSEQNEIRYLVYDIDEKPLKFKIGNLNDIASIFSLKCKIDAVFNYTNYEEKNND